MEKTTRTKVRGNGELLTVKEAAAELGVTPRWISKLCETGRLRLYKEGRKPYRIYRESLGAVRNLRKGNPNWVTGKRQVRRRRGAVQGAVQGASQGSGEGTKAEQ